MICSKAVNGIESAREGKQNPGVFTVTPSKLERIFSTSSEIALEALPGVA